MLKKLKKAMSKLERKMERTNPKAKVEIDRLLKKAEAIQKKIDFIVEDE